VLRLSLRLRVLLWIVAINVAVVGAETWVLARQLGQKTRQETVDLAEDLIFTLHDKLQTDPRTEAAERRALEAEVRDALAPYLREEARARAGELAAVAVAHLLPASQRVLGPYLLWPSREFLADLAGLQRSFAARLDPHARGSAEDLAALAVARLLPRSGVNVGPLLSWPSWDRFADAMLVDWNLARDADGLLVPRGVALNPVGRSRRDPRLDEQAVFEAVQAAIDSGRPIDGVQGGTVVPIAGSDGVFGACWYVLPPPAGGAGLLVRYVLPAFAFSTVLLSAVTFFALRRFVLDPVARLAQGASRVAEGDVSTRVPESGGNDELSSLIATFNRMTARVGGFQEELAAEVARATAAARQAEAAAMTQRRLAAMGELAAGIAHEINNPLGGLMNAVEALGRSDLPAERRVRYLELLGVGLERIGRTVGQLLRFTPRSTHAMALSVSGPVLDAVALVRHRARALGVQLSVGDGVRFDDGPEIEPALAAQLAALPPVLGEAHEIAQAVLNLLVNALDALEERPGGARGGQVRVTLAAWEGGVAIEVADDGPGVPPEVLERAADLFFSTKAPGKGTGLGLSIVHNVVAAHGGRVQLASRPGEGFRVRIELPAAGART
jgi:signal transduction histidine kinase